MTEMQRNCMLLAAAVLTTVPTLLPAQEPAVPPRVTRDRARAERDQVRAFAFGDNRARIGVVLRPEADAETDKVGAKIEGVSPGGPAEKAGLKVGDIITKLNGTALGGLKAGNDEESGPGRKLIALARRLEPGDTVRLEYRRGNDTKPTTPSHAMRILRSYDKGETVSIDILRKQKRMTVAWKVPARETRMFRGHEGHSGDEEQSGWRGVRRWRVRGWRPLRFQRV